MKTAHYFTILIAFFLLLAVNACSHATPANLAIEEQITPTPIYTIERDSVEIAASSFQELAYYSDMIVVGQVVSKEQILNTARDPGDLTQPDPQLFGITQFYRVNVESVLKGEPVTSLLVGQHQGCLEITSDTGPTSAEIEAEITRNEQITFIPLSLNTRYLFFLIHDRISYDLGGYQSTDLYGGVLEPWRFRLTSDEFLIPETHLFGTNSCVLQETLQSVGVIIIDVSDGVYTPDNNNVWCDPYPPPATDFPELPGGLTPYP